MFPKFQTALIACALAGGFLPFERTLFAPEDDPAAGGGGGGGGAPPDPGAGGTPPAKSFTQDDLNKIVQREKAGLERQLNDLKKQAESAAKIPDLEKQLAEMREQLELAGKTAEEKARIQAENAAKRIDAERAQREKELADLKVATEAEKAAHLATRKRYHATSGLTEAKAFPEAIEDAISSFLQLAEMDFDEAGRVTSVRYGDVAHKTVAEAAKAFLKDKPYFAAAAAGGGAGTRSSNGALPRGKDWKEASPGELFDLAAKTPIKGGVGAPMGLPDDDD